MQAADVWPWEWHTVKYRTKDLFPSLCNLLTDTAAAESWRERLAAETARLMAATPPEPPPEPWPDYSHLGLYRDA